MCQLPAGPVSSANRQLILSLWMNHLFSNVTTPNDTHLPCTNPPLQAHFCAIEECAYEKSG